MKTMFQIQLIASVLVLFNIGCTKENEPMKTNGDNDTIPIVDTLPNDSLTLCDSLTCTYDSICLDYNKYDTVGKAELIGEWELIAYVDTSDCEIETEPSNITQSIKLIFYENDSISGVTVSNTYSGKYTLTGNKINFSEIIMTEIMEPEWGRKYSELIYYTDYFTLNGNKLIINSKEILIFTKK
jgi:heat shock protein HslJ